MFAVPPLASREYEAPVRLADWLELNLLTQEERFLSVSATTDILTLDPPDNADESERRGEADDEVEGQAGSSYWVDAENSATSAFAELNTRSVWLGERYPIDISDGIALLKPQTEAQGIYEFMVLLRARQLYQGALNDDGNESGFLFEELVKYALGTYTNSGPEHRVRFGIAGGSRGDGLPQSLVDAVKEISRRTHERMGEVPGSGQGDYKADAIAWKPFGDDLPGQLVLISQATISEGDWFEDEPAPRWTVKTPNERRLVNWLARPVTAVAFPETLSLTPRAALDGLTFQSIPFDRLRLLSVLCDHDLPTELREQMQLWVENTKHGIPK